MQPVLNSTNLYQLIQKRFSQPAWVVFSEVSDGTGANLRRYADAVAMSIWPSRGLELHGFEIKCNRSDWKKELEDPSKSNAVQKYCDRWWVVVNDPKIIHEGELPPTWGLLVPYRDGLKALKEAPKLEAVPITRNFLAALLRRSFESLDSVRVESYEKGYKEGQKKLPDDLNRKLERTNEELQDLRNSLKEFEDISGIKINQWGIGHVADLVNKMQAFRYSDPTEKMNDIKKDAQRIVDLIDNQIEVVKIVREKLNEEI